MIDDLRIAWAALRESERPHGNALAVHPLAGVSSSAGVVYIGMDDHERSHLLLPADTPGPEEDRIQAVRITMRTLVVGSRPRRFVDVVLEAPGLAEVFDHFVIAVIEQVQQRPKDHPGAVAAEVLDTWRRFLALGGRPLGPDQLAPLFAEMSVLADIARLGPGAVAAWRGPGARHDFARGDCAIEVKATRAHTAREVTIHGVDQLEPTPGGRLFLEFVRLEEAVGDGLSVPALVDRILESGVSASQLYDAVDRAGLSVGDYDAARDVLFRVRERALLPVVPPFPRIVTESFREGSMPSGVRDLVYRADLDPVIATRLDSTQAESVYAAMAGASS